MPPSPDKVKRDLQQAEEKAKRLREARLRVMREPPECNEPTQHLPGTVEKIEVMRRRAEQGFRIWHSRDARRPTD